MKKSYNRSIIFKTIKYTNKLDNTNSFQSTTDPTLLEGVTEGAGPLWEGGAGDVVVGIEWEFEARSGNTFRNFEFDLLNSKDDLANCFFVATDVSIDPVVNVSSTIILFFKITHKWE